jgi:multimeric flavodoxin WrbA
MKGVIIQGSSRNDGNTKKIVEQVRDKSGFDLIELSDKNIGPFDYDFANSDDDFLPLMRHIVEHYDLIIFATPVYWYSMSGILKNFFDRITDCLQLEKETGRQLRGKMMAMISCGSDVHLDEAFKTPFKSSADYLGMHYLGDVHTWIKNKEIPKDVEHHIDLFLNKLINSTEMV